MKMNAIGHLVKTDPLKPNLVRRPVLRSFSVGGSLGEGGFKRDTLLLCGALLRATFAGTTTLKSLRPLRIKKAEARTTSAFFRDSLCKRIYFMFIKNLQPSQKPKLYQKKRPIISFLIIHLLLVFASFFSDFFQIFTDFYSSFPPFSRPIGRGTPFFALRSRFFHPQLF
jgi:hypothetical protein